MSKRSYRLFDNQFASILAGPGREDDTGRELTTWTKAGNCETHWSNGAKTTITTGPSKEVCNVEPEDSVRQEENVSKSIYCQNGDFVLVADGNIKLKAKNIILETEGISPEGKFEVISNGLISIQTNETLRIQGGEVQILSEKDLVLDANGFLKMIGDMKNGGSSYVASLVSDYLGGGWVDTLSGISKSLRGI